MMRSPLILSVFSLCLAVNSVDVGATVSAPLIAKPKYQDADQWRKDLRAAIDENIKALRTPDSIPAQGRRWSLLLKRADKLFGENLTALEPFASCHSTASYFAAAWQSQVQNLSRAEPVSVAAQSMQAFGAGENYGRCRDEIDALEISR